MKDNFANSWPVEPAKFVLSHSHADHYSFLLYLGEVQAITPYVKSGLLCKTTKFALDGPKSPNNSGRPFSAAGDRFVSSSHLLY